MNAITVTTANGLTVANTPYNPAFPAGAKALGGKWEPASKAWSFDARDEERVLELVRSIYGTDGRTTEKTVTVRVEIEWSGEATLRLAGAELAHRPGRDQSVRLGQGVVLLKGGFARKGGSMRYPVLAAEEGTVLEVRDVPLSQARLMVEQGEDESCVVSILEPASLVRAALLEERTALLARLAELDAALALPEAAMETAAVLVADGTNRDEALALAGALEAA